MQFASAGFWGRGLYFAKDAGYSHAYATGYANDWSDRLQHDEKEMLLVSLLTGRVATMGINKDLVVPPFLNAAKSGSGESVKFTGGNGYRFNSVGGYTVRPSGSVSGPCCLCARQLCASICSATHDAAIRAAGRVTEVQLAVRRAPGPRRGWCMKTGERTRCIWSSTTPGRGMRRERLTHPGKRRAAAFAVALRR